MSTTKRMKGVPVYHDELKIKRTVNLTDTAWAILKAKSSETGSSISEYIETWAKGLNELH
jgi:hypothetical protein